MREAVQTKASEKVKSEGSLEMVVNCASQRTATGKLTDRRSRLTDRRSRLTDRRSRLTDRRSRLTDRRSRLTDRRSRYARGVAKIAIALAAGFVALAFSSISALADAPAWNLTAVALPSNFTPNSTGTAVPADANFVTRGNSILLTARNLGKAPIVGADRPIRVSVELHGGVAVGIESGSLNCKQPAGPCVGTGTIEPGQSLTIEVTVEAGNPGTASDAAAISGGEVNGQPLTPASVEQQIPIGEAPAPFGIEPSSVLAELINTAGGPETQAGSHPYDLGIDFVLKNKIISTSAGPKFAPAEDVKDVAVELPPGLVGDELAVGQCESSVLEEARCQGASQVGAIHPQIEGLGLRTYAVFNMKPSNGHTNELGFNTKNAFSVQMPTVVRTGGDYGLTSITPNVPNFNAVLATEVNIWGVPGESSHDEQRVLAGYKAEHKPDPGETPREEEAEGGHHPALPPTPFLTMPAQCGKPLIFKIAVDSYVAPGRVLPDGEPDLTDGNWKTYTVKQPPLEGCERLQSFAPHITVAPATTYADTPAGTTVEVSVPQGEGLTNPETLATSTLKNTKVTLPEGLVINPGQANGLGACQFSEDGVGTTGPPSCPAASKVGTAELETPLLPDKLEGNVYVLQSSPPHLQLLIAMSGDGVNLKLVVNVTLNEQTGQLTAHLGEDPRIEEENPGLAGHLLSPSQSFTHFRMTFSGGAQAALMTPPSCGVYSTMADFTAWSSPFTPDFLSVNGFGIDHGPGGSPCASPLPFAPSMIAGATTDRAGGYTGFSLLLQRGDGEQRIEGLRFKTPPGLSGVLASVPLCEEPQAAAGACPSGSQIGHTIVGAGAGPAPLYIPEPGHAPAPIYLTGPYRGAPFGLSIVVPVIAGPFNLGTVVVRAAISVDPHTAQLTVSTDALPQILDGVQTDLRQIDAVVDRPGFMFNPTNCDPSSFSGTAQSAEGATAAISSHAQVGSCQSLKFTPKFTVSTSGKTSKALGASLMLKVSRASGPGSGQANFASAKIDLPKQLPSRLTTLQKACAAVVFEANPAACPAASLVGHARVRTPLLPVPLEGPAYFVSHGGEAFPSVIFVLQGDNVVLDVVSTTFISKSGITSATLKTVPDAPFTSFELVFPQGKYSALAANGNLCKSKLAMPTKFVAQNGLVVTQTTKIRVTGCAKARAAKKKAQKASRARGSSHVGHGRTR